MSTTIDVDDEVYDWLKKQARSLRETHNTVLRRIAGLRPRDEGASAIRTTEENLRPHLYTPNRALNGRLLNERWHVGARQALYHRDGHWYNNLRTFPGALFDPYGYVLFKTEQAYRSSAYLQIGDETNVPGGIKSIPGYVRMVKD